MRAALRDYDAPDFVPAPEAGLTFASVGLMQRLKSTSLTVRIHIVGDRRAAMPDGGGQNFHDGLVQRQRAGL